MNIKYIDEVTVQNKRVLLRVDYNVTLSPDYQIADDERIERTLPTIKLLLGEKNRLILLTHLGRPDSRDIRYSLKKVADHLQKLLPSYRILFVDDFHSPEGKRILENQNEQEIVLLENLRFFDGEKKNDIAYAKELSQFGDVYVNDAFGVSHRSEASVVGIPTLLPSYGGLLLKREVEMIAKCMDNPTKPYIAIIGGAKISTKIHLLGKLMGIADELIVGGAIANTLLKDGGYEIGKSIEEEKELEHAKTLLTLSKEKNTTLILPVDVVVAKNKSAQAGEIKKIEDVAGDDMILDVGPETEALYGASIAKARTIVWNGPIGYFENPAFRRGTDFIYYSIAQNNDAVSIVGGGETLTAISRKEFLGNITHISTGGGAMLEFIEKGTLPGLTALEQ